MYFDEPLDRVRPADRRRVEVRCCVVTAGTDDVLHPAARPDRRRRRGGGGVAVRAMTAMTRSPSLPEGFRLLRYDDDRQHQRRGEGAGPRRRRRRARWSGPASRPPGAAGAAAPGCRRRAISICRWCCGPTARRRAPRSSALSRRSALGDALAALCRAGAASCATNGRTTCSPTAGSSPASCSNRRLAASDRVDFVVIGDRRQHRRRARAMSSTRRPRSRPKAWPGSPRRRCSAAFARHFEVWARRWRARGLRSGARGLAGAGERARRSRSACASSAAR